MELKEVMDDDFDRIIYSYIKHSTELISEIKRLMNSGEVTEVKRLVHSFKSSSKNVGAIALGNMAYEIETQLTNGVEIDLDEAIKDLIISYDQVVKALEKWLSE